MDRVMLRKAVESSNGLYQHVYILLIEQSKPALLKYGGVMKLPLADGCLKLVEEANLLFPRGVGEMGDEVMMSGEE